jgi:hypothetical protein
MPTGSFPVTILARTLAVLVLVAWLLPPATVYAQAADYPQDVAIPNGYFYTQAAPGQKGAGYRVANEAGIPFWDEFQRLGGLDKLGYPVTRRFSSADDVVQLFQFGALRWRPKDGRAEIVKVEEVGRPPEAAKKAEPSPWSSGDAARYPWSGWWWPASFQAPGPYLFDPGGPLAKYDRFVASLGQPDPKTVEWERAELIFAGYGWAGHCNGWAAAALLEPEPSETRVLNGVSFTVADQKGLLTSYHFADSALWAVGGDERDASPAEFHRTLRTWMGGERKGMVFTFRLGDQEVWSYPAFKFESVVGPDPVRPNVWLARTTVWFVHNDVPASFVGGRPWPAPEGKLFEYTLIGDPEKPEGGEWAPSTAGSFGRPHMIWYPDPARRNLDRQLAAPGLDYKLIEQILRGS